MKQMLDSISKVTKHPAEQSRAELIVVGDLFEANGHKSCAGRIYDITGLCPALGASHFQQDKMILEIRRLD